MNTLRVQYTKKGSISRLWGQVRYLDPDTGVLYCEPHGRVVDAVSFGFRLVRDGVWKNHRGSVVEAVLLPTRGSPAPTSDFHEKKADQGKPRFDLLDNGMPNALLDVAKVLTWAVEVKGYQPHSWKDVPEAKRRYQAALSRHRNAQARGEVLDPESGLPHAAHINCCTLFLAELDYIEEKK